MHIEIPSSRRFSIFTLFLAAMTAIIVSDMPVTGSTLAGPAARVETNETARKNYDRALALWTRSAIADYTMKIRFGAFSPLAGEWTITVKHGTLARWSFRNFENNPRDRAFASKLTVDALFEKAAGSFGNKNDSPMKVYAVYDATDGHVTLVVRKPGTAGMRNTPKDTSYRYEVIAFKKLDPGEKEL
jgi:hypothetical protein